MPPVRILLTNLPRMLREILRGAARDNDEVELVEVLNPGRAVRDSGQSRVVLVTGATSATAILPGPTGESVQLVVVSPEGRDAELFEVVRRKPALHDLSPDALLALALEAGRGRTDQTALGAPS